MQDVLVVFVMVKERGRSGVVVLRGRRGVADRIWTNLAGVLVLRNQWLGTRVNGCSLLGVVRWKKGRTPSRNPAVVEGVLRIVTSFGLSLLRLRNSK